MRHSAWMAAGPRPRTPSCVLSVWHHVGKVSLIHIVAYPSWQITLDIHWGIPVCGSWVRPRREIFQCSVSAGLRGLVSGSSLYDSFGRCAHVAKKVSPDRAGSRRSRIRWRNGASGHPGYCCREKPGSARYCHRQHAPAGNAARRIPLEYRRVRTADGAR